MEYIIVKVKAGILLRNPATQKPIEEKGTRVPDNSFWRRRIQAGDVELTEIASKKEKPKSFTASKNKE